MHADMHVVASWFQPEDISRLLKRLYCQGHKWTPLGQCVQTVSQTAQAPDCSWNAPGSQGRTHLKEPLEGLEVCAVGQLQDLHHLLNPVIAQLLVNGVQVGCTL